MWVVARWPASILTTRSSHESGAKEPKGMLATKSPPFWASTCAPCSVRGELSADASLTNAMIVLSDRTFALATALASVLLAMRCCASHACLTSGDIFPKAGRCAHAERVANERRAKANHLLIACHI